MASPTAAVVIASAQSVAKVYVIGAVGYFSVKCKMETIVASHQILFRILVVLFFASADSFCDFLQILARLQFCLTSL
jgi:hypothetical protein